MNECDLLLQRHVSLEQTLLNLQAADVMRKTGYLVNLPQPEFTLLGDFVRTDLTMVDDQGMPHFVKVECD